MEFIEDLVVWVEIAPATKREILDALADPSKDFEDTLQMKCVEAAHCGAFITRNPKDFENTKIPVFTRAEFHVKFC